MMDVMGGQVTFGSPRVRRINDKEVRSSGQFVLYWMTSTRRYHYNAALERAIDISISLNKPLLVIECISVRHSDDLDAQGALVDDYEVIQYLNMESNPVGRGKNDAALMVESESFAESQRNLLDTIWEEAVPYETASKRFTEERIVDPLKLTIDSGSFLEKIREVLQISDDIPEEDTPFNPDAFLASGLEISDARRNLESGGIEALSAFGIDIESLLRQVGNRVGEELSFSLRNIEGNIEYLNEIMDWWEFAHQ